MAARKKMPGRDRAHGLSRRRFLVSAALTGAGLVATHLPLKRKKAAAPGASQINVALLGAGSQGRVLMGCCLKIPGIRFLAVCDIWPYHQRYAKNILKRYGHLVNVYEDYREMLVKEKKLDAVLIATPDWVHAEQTIACLKAKKHVYCEKEMSRTVEESRAMVTASRQARRLLQIGHQRRSNPRYRHVEHLIHKDKVLGPITHTFGQWNRSQLIEYRVPPAKIALSAEALKRHGYDTMHRMRNWRWYRKFSAGPMADLGSHQVDIFNWFLKAGPRAVTASGGTDYYKSEWYDNVMAIYEYRATEGPVRSFYQVLNTTSHGGYQEAFMGKEASIAISEDPTVGFFFREPTSQASRSWEDQAEKVKAMERNAIELKIGESRRGQKRDSKTLQLEGDVQKPVHQPHLENFFNAMRRKEKLTCPGEVAFDTAVTILRTNEAVAAKCRIEYDPKGFKA